MTVTNSRVVVDERVEQSRSLHHDGVGPGDDAVVAVQADPVTLGDRADS